MQSYKRKITYFYQYHNGNVGTTAGFLKLEIRGDKVKIIINIQEPPGLPFKEASLYFYHEAGDHLAAIRVDKVESINGILTYQNRTDWQQMFDTGRDLYTFDGVAVVYNDSHYYIGDFKDKSRKDYALVRKETRTEGAVSHKGSYVDVKAVNDKIIETEKNPEKDSNIAAKGGEKEETQTQAPDIGKERPEEENQRTEASEKDERSEAAKAVEKEDRKGEKGAEPQAAGMPEKEQNLSEVQGLFERGVEEEQVKRDVYEKCENCPYHKKHLEQQENVNTFEKMIKEYPKLPMYGATELFDCVRIHPKDIGKLDMRNWKLGVNSFLTHGFYTYQYLLLGKMRFDDGSERPIIGVPGVYSGREKYLANMFGFDQFIPVKKTGVKTGSFGYWIVEISPYL